MCSNTVFAFGPELALQLHPNSCYRAFVLHPSACGFFFCPATLASPRSAAAGIQDMLPSLSTLTFRSTRNQRGNCIPIVATVRLYRNRILQLGVFD
jgi:hypothetical protein